MKDFIQKYISNVWEIDGLMAYTSQKIRFDWTRMQGLFTNAFPLDEKKKLSVAGVSEKGRKKGFH